MRRILVDSSLHPVPVNFHLGKAVFDDHFFDFRQFIQSFHNDKLIDRTIIKINGNIPAYLGRYFLLVYISMPTTLWPFS
jgi:hypothetical protein